MSGISEQVPCCGKIKKNCDFRYYGNGPAYEDMMDYIRDENIWLRKYHEAWNMATENGHVALLWLDPTEGPLRHELSDEAKVDCFATTGTPACTNQMRS